ncbi:pilus assembly protein TadG-related protein [Paraburkholderia bryophila]|uniref:TadG family pilus assembly protein n=1 Tax=Paraburkholderia bryophila TaxID=420952 RepID=UPI00234B748B|nr:TadG family pilus assembly protein [Paraburkholderia bryophila]WCM21242.1 pilus assembly protein TadG-related protein [Paraburkholderia bryophila]
MRGRLSSATRSDRCAHPRAVRRAGTRRHGQRGAIAVLAVIWLSVAIAALGVLDVGNVYFARRSLQRTADLAALAAVQMISSSGGCAAATTAAQQNAAANGFSAGGTTTIATTCGRWDTSTNTYFGTTGNPLNAVQVQTSQVIPYFFLGPSRAVTTTATALASNIDAFSLSTGIATINTQQSALLNAILGGLLNTSVALTVGNFQSLAGATIKLSDLMVALGASSMQGLLSTTVSYQQLMLAMVQALQAGGDTVDAAILQTLAVTVPGGQNITIGDNGQSAPGLLALGLSNPNAAATATIDALDAVMVAAQIAQSNPNGTAPVINVTTGLLGVAGISLQIINPPVLAVGEGGTTTVNGVSTARTMARTAVANVTIKLLPALLPTLTVGVPPLVSASIATLNTPLVVTLGVATGTATLNPVDCESTKAATTATIQVAPGILNACIAGDASCSTPVNIATVTATFLGLTAQVANVVINNVKLKLAPGTTTPLVFNGASGSFDYTQSANSNALGSDASLLTMQLLGNLGNVVKVSLLNNLIDISSLLAPIASAVTNALTPLLQPVFALLDTIVVPTLSLLGIQIGTATVHNMSLTCGVPQLVN